MRRGSLLVVLVAVALLVAAGLALRGDRGDSLMRWFAALHGSPRR